MRGIAVLLAFALGGCEVLADIDCLAGNTGECPPAPVDLVDLSGDGKAQECDYVASFPLESAQCSDGRTATSGGVDPTSCLARLAGIQPTCTATTSDLETCAMAVADDPCARATTDECHALAACGL